MIAIHVEGSVVTSVVTHTLFLILRTYHEIIPVTLLYCMIPSFSPHTCKLYCSQSALGKQQKTPCSICISDRSSSFLLPNASINQGLQSTKPRRGRCGVEGVGASDRLRFID